VGEPSTASAGGVVSFGPFQLLPAQRLLLEGEAPVRLGSRALAILTTLVERPGELVTKGELMARVWPDTFVDEAALRVHVSALRRALGDGQAGRRFVANVPGRGYQFLAPVEISEPRTAPSHVDMAGSRPHNLPFAQTRPVGRAGAMRALADLLPKQWFITIVGAGGIGKTTVALALAEALLPAYEDGVRIVDLAPLEGPQLVSSALGVVLGLSVHPENAAAQLVDFLRDKRMLIVLDSCEHVIDAAASLAEQLVAGAAGVHILATSREPLRAKGEWVHRLQPLDIPADPAKLTAAEALAYPAVQLFVERAAAILDGFELSDADAPIVSAICRKLGGIALAIELAAARVDAFTLHQLELLLDDRFRILNRGRRTARPRHRSLAAALDWSYEFLPEVERAVLRRLSVFAGLFDLDAAIAVAGDDEIDVVDALADLVAKSLITADVGGPIVRYRLLDTTRAYALEKLVESDALNAIACRHAQYYRDLFERAEPEWEQQPTAEWLTDYGHQIANLRAALDWAFSPDGDASVGVALTAAAVPLWMHLSLMEESRDRVEQALDALGTAADQDARREMKLYAALAASLIQARGPDPELRAVSTKALEIAERLDDADYQLRSLYGLWLSHNSGSARALELAERFCALAAKQRNQDDLLIGDRMMGISQHFLGDLPGARRHLERAFVHPTGPHHRSQIIRYQVDPRVTAGIMLARVLWLQGYPDQAVSAGERAVEDAGAANHPISTCYALAYGRCVIVLWIGDLDRTERYLDLLLDRAARHALPYWRDFGLTYQAILVMKRGDVDRGLRLLRAVFDIQGEPMFIASYLMVLCEMAEGLGAAGQFTDGLTVVERAIERSERDEVRWLIAELLRVKGELVLVRGGIGAAAAAEDLFRQALDWARRQGALAWELRAATSLARLMQAQGRSADAMALLQPVYDRFTEGFETADLKAARALIDALSAPPVGAVGIA
jgi:predicted ATPase/DNA-binding winged helix-turn-helix (wHTH) protein